MFSRNFLQQSFNVSPSEGTKRELAQMSYKNCLAKRSKANWIIKNPKTLHKQINSKACFGRCYRNYKPLRKGYN